MKNILLLEDDESLNRGISFKLKKEGYTVFSAYDIATAKELFKQKEISLIISDINLPDGTGLEFCQQVRENSDVLIIFLTALDTEVDIVNGYDVGGDDYITKPFSLMVLISKVNALMRRIKTNKAVEKLISGSIIFYPEEIKVTKDNKEVASEMGVPFTDYNGNLSSKQCGSVGGEMVKRMVQQYEQGI